MCGIAGFSGNFEPGLLTRMSEAIAYRGPDGAGVYYDREARVGLAHRRLAIIDLSPAGNQPMEDCDGRVSAVFNGEIYNFRELRAELKSKGCRFSTNTDTEVLLQLYLLYGKEMLTRLNGMFAFAIWDKERRQILIARDGLGVKPLYYAATPKGFIFASEIKALLQESSCSREIDPTAIAAYLTYLWCPAPRSILKSVRKLEPGMAMIIVEGRVREQWRHYELPFGRQPKVPRSIEATTGELRFLLDQAVKRQMVSDVPVGAFLSGGLDSSAIVAAARKHSTARLQCFTIDLADEHGVSTEGITSDLPFARRVAQHLDVDLHTVAVGPEMIDRLQEMIYFLDEPQADPAPLNALFISKLAKQGGIKVLLSGAGGDDIFTGYRRHQALNYEKYWRWLPKPVRFGVSESVKLLGSRPAALRRIRKAFAYAGLDDSDRAVSYFFWLDPSRAVELLHSDYRREIEASCVLTELRAALRSIPSNATDIDRMLHLESRFFLADHNLNYTDRMSMAHGVEARVPLLDPDLINFAAALPDDMKQRGGTSKWIFKKAMEGVLPNDIIYRPKTGFGAPLRAWLHGPLAPLVESMLSKEALRRNCIFDPEGVSRLLTLDRAGKLDASYSLFAVLCVELWCSMFLQPIVVSK